MAQPTAKDQLKMDEVITDILNTIERDREREIVSRRFGLFDRKETLEQIGELLGITRERVRQLEKAVVARLKSASENDLPHMTEVESTITDQLKKMGKAARITNLSAALSKSNTKIDQARLAFLSELSTKLSVIEENDHYYHSVGIATAHSEKVMKDLIAKIIEAVTKLGKPVDIDTLTKKLNHTDSAHIAALASISKHLATLNGRWGLTKWPMVNPKNIRDKIYVVLFEASKPMHFNDIAKSIQGSDFKRKDVTVQAIHNELIKDGRFVLIGRGIYALKEWGYEKGTVADIIAEILKKENGPLHRDEIVKRVLKSRQVKETTILLNLQGKPQFKRVAKATYALAA